MIDNSRIGYAGQVSLGAAGIAVGCLAESPVGILQAAGLGFLRQVLDAPPVAYHRLQPFFPDDHL
ncbi:hypothetical protein D3C87_2142010 [compost metagenome]